MALPMPLTSPAPLIWVGTNFLNLVDPDPAHIHLCDIARGLSRVARFNGHTSRFLSVAEHSVNCVEALARWCCGNPFEDDHLRAIARDVLLHDAAAAYLGDVVSPLKALLPEYRALETRMNGAITARFGLTHRAPEWVKRVDLEMLALEKRALMPGAPDWPCLEGVYLHEDFPVAGHGPQRAEADFLMMAHGLGFAPVESRQPGPV